MFSRRFRSYRAVAVPLLVFMVAAIAPAAATSDVSLSPSSSPLPGSRFQAADGNQSECATPSCSPPGGSTLFDWGSTSYGSLINTIVDPSNPDNVFAGGSKEDQPDLWAFASPSESTPGKSNFKVVWDVIEGDATQFFYLAFRRAETGGNTFLTFELNQDQKRWTNSTGAVIPCRTTGDLLVTYNVANSDATNIALRAEKWTSTSTDAATGCAKTGSLSEYTGLADGTDVQGAVNTSLSPSLSGELPSSRPAVGSIPSLLESTPSCSSVSGWVCAGLFGEAGINLKGVFGTITQRPCFAFGTAWAHSRSSESNNSAMQDYVAPASVKLRSCTISGFKWNDLNGDGIWQKTGLKLNLPCQGGRSSLTAMTTERLTLASQPP